MLVVVAVAATGYRLAGIVAAVSAAAWFDFFLTRPYERFTITRTTDLETTILILIIGVQSHGLLQGRYLMVPEPGSRPTLEQRLVAVAFADQVGAALAASRPVTS